MKDDDALAMAAGLVAHLPAEYRRPQQDRDAHPDAATGDDFARLIVACHRALSRLGEARRAGGGAREALRDVRDIFVACAAEIADPERITWWYRLGAVWYAVGCVLRVLDELIGQLEAQDEAV